MDIGSALHDDIPQILFLYALPSAPDGGIVDVLHLRNFYKAKTGYVVIQRFGFGIVSCILPMIVSILE